MAKVHVCCECGNPLPEKWRPIATRTVKSVCPACASRHISTKSARRRAVQAAIQKTPSQGMIANDSN